MRIDHGMRGAIAAPKDLTELIQWCLWRWENVDGRETKVPYSVRGYKASSTDPRTWAPFEEVIQLWQRRPTLYAGPGFVFTKENRLVGIDLDNCLDGESNVKPWASNIVERFADCYTEISPSGKGLKIWARGALPANIPGVRIGDGQIEMYDHGRYFAVTGRPFRGAPLDIEDHAADLLELYERLTGGRKTWPLQPLEGGRIPHGRQHSTLVSIAGTLRRRHVCDEAIEACLQSINERQCERPGPRENITRMVHSSRKWGVA
jgi:primase-polymerase (primpol)-like protein